MRRAEAMVPRRPRPLPWWPANATPARLQERLLTGLSGRFGDLQLANIGSSLKFCLLAEGNADCYPRLAPTGGIRRRLRACWRSAGGELLDLKGEARPTEPAKASSARRRSSACRRRPGEALRVDPAGARAGLMDDRAYAWATAVLGTSH